MEIDSETNSCDAPLSKVLPNNFNGKTVYDLFPNFKPNQALVFSKLFSTNGSSTGSNPSKPKANKWQCMRRMAVDETSAVSEGSVLLTDGEQAIDGQPIRSKYPAVRTNRLRPYVIDERLVQLPPCSFDQAAARVESFCLPTCLQQPNISEGADEQTRRIPNRETTRTSVNTKDAFNLDDYSPNIFYESEWFTSEVTSLWNSLKKIRIKCLQLSNTKIQDGQQNGVSKALLPKPISAVPEDVLNIKNSEIDYSLDDLILDSCDHNKIQKRFSHIFDQPCRFSPKRSGWVPTKDVRSLSEYRKRRTSSNLSAEALGSYPSNIRQYATTDDENWLNVFPDNDTIEGLQISRSLIMDPSFVDLEYIIQTNARKTEKLRKRIAKTVSKDLNCRYDVIQAQNVELHPSTESHYITDLYNATPSSMNSASRLAMQDSQLGTWLKNHLRHIHEAYRLSPRLFPTYLDIQSLRAYYRKPLIDKDPNSQTTKHFYTSAKCHFIRSSIVYLCEYIEQFPVILNQPGMGICLRNFMYAQPDMLTDGAKIDFTNIVTPDLGPPVVYTQNNKGPIIGNLPESQDSKQIVQTLECNLFKAHTAVHKLQLPYYLLLSSKGRINMVYRIDNVFLMGQQFPQMEIPSPVSKRVSFIKRDFLQSHIYRQFARPLSINRLMIGMNTRGGSGGDESGSSYSSVQCSKVKLEDIKRSFPYMPEAAIRKKLKQCAVYNRITSSNANTDTANAQNKLELSNQTQKTSSAGSYGGGGDGGGAVHNAWFLKEDFQLPGEDEIRKIISPEMCCCFYSMQATEQRLIDCGVLEKETSNGASFVAKNLLSLTGAWNTRLAQLIAELHNTPWNVSKTCLDSYKNKCELVLDGPSEPTCIGVGFALQSTSATVAAMSAIENKQTIASSKQHPLDTLFSGQIITTRQGGPANSCAKHCLNASAVQAKTKKSECRKQTQTKRNASAGLKKGITKSTDKTIDSQSASSVDIARLPLKNAKQILTKIGISEITIRSLTKREIVQIVKTLTSKRSKMENTKIASFISLLKSPSSSLTTVRTALKKLIGAFEPEKSTNATPSKPSGLVASTKSDNSTYQHKIQSLLEKQLNFLKNGVQKPNTGGISSDIHPLMTSKRPASSNRVLRIKRYNDSVDSVANFEASTTQTKSESFQIEEVNDQNLIDQYLQVKSSLSLQQISQMLADHMEIMMAESIDRICNKVKTTSSADTLSVQNCDQNDDEKSKSIRKKKTVNAGGKDSASVPIRRKRKAEGDNTVASKRADLTSRQENEESSNCSIRFKCGACGGLGHMRTNRECPAYVQKDSKTDGNKKNDNLPFYYLKQMTSTKMVISIQSKATTSHTNLLTSTTQSQQQDNVSTSIDTCPQPVHKPLTLKIPKALVICQDSLQSDTSSLPQSHHDNPQNKEMNVPYTASTELTPTIAPVTVKPTSKTQHSTAYVNKPKKRRAIDCVVERPAKSCHRRLVDPLVSLSTVFEGIINSLRDLPEAQMFLTPVNLKDVPDYRVYVDCPIDLQTIRQKAMHKQYENRETFLRDMKQLMDNSLLYNGTESQITVDAHILFSKCVSLLVQNEERLITLEKRVNPLLDDDVSVVLCYILDQMFTNDILKVPNVWEFMKPVNKHKYPEYYQQISHPIDLETIRGKITGRLYKTEDQFMSDINLLHSNCVLFNGEHSDYAEATRAIISVCQQRLAESPHRPIVSKFNSQNDDQESSMENVATLNEPVNTSLSEPSAELVPSPSNFDECQIECEDQITVTTITSPPPPITIPVANVQYPLNSDINSLPEPSPVAIVNDDDDLFGEISSDDEDDNENGQ